MQAITSLLSLFSYKLVVLSFSINTTFALSKAIACPTDSIPTTKQTTALPNKTLLRNNSLLYSPAGSWGKDSLAIVNNYLAYRELFIQDKYKDALPAWNYIYKAAPASSKLLLMNGEYIYKNLIEENVESMVCADSTEHITQDPTLCKIHGGVGWWRYKNPKQTLGYMDSITRIYYKREQFFGERGFLLTQKMRLWQKYFPQQKDKIEQLQLDALNATAENAPFDLIYQYFLTLYDHYNNQELSLDSLLINYEDLVEIADFNRLTHPEEGSKYEKYALRMEQIMSKFIDQEALNDTNFAVKPTDCALVLQTYGMKHGFQPSNIPILQQYYRRLKRLRCLDEERYWTVLKTINDIQPSPMRLRMLARHQVVAPSPNLNLAEQWYNQALALETDNWLNAYTWLQLAYLQQKQKNFPQAREYARQAVQLQPGWGEPFLLIGDLYSQSASMLKADGLGGASVYWVAVDMYEHAKKIDPMLYARANEKIVKHSAQFPKVTPIQTGKSVVVEGWIQQTTVMR